VDDRCLALPSFPGRGSDAGKIFKRKKYISGLGCLAYFSFDFDYSADYFLDGGISFLNIMEAKHFFNTLLIFMMMIILGLIGVFLMSNSEICKLDISCYTGQILL